MSSSQFQAWKGNILIVDDQPGNLRLLSQMLVDKGYRVRKAINGELALKGAKSEPPDLILLDIKMPHMDGYEVCERLKSWEETQEIPIIFISIFDEVFDKVRAFKIGGSDYITKPFHVEEVLARVENHLRLHQQQKLLEEHNLLLEQEIYHRRQAERALREREGKLRGQNQVLAQLAKNQVLYFGDFSTAVQEITQAAAQTLEIERVSVWIFDLSGLQLQCRDLYLRSRQEHLSGQILNGTDYPHYTNSLQKDWMIVAPDVYQEPRLKEFLESYFCENKITSLLDTAVRLGGQTVGIVRLEQVKTLHHWTADEQNFASSLADLVSLALEARERMRTQEAQRVSEEKFALAFYSSPDPMVIVTLTEGRYIEVNDSFLNIFGFTRDEVINKTHKELDLWVDQEDPLRIISYLRENGTISNMEFELRTKSDELRTILFSAELIHLEGEKCLLAVANDITDRKRTELALQVEQQRSERLLLNILPRAIAEQLKQYRGSLAEQFAEATILFADIVGFTQLSASISPLEMVHLLNRIFSTFDQIVEKYGLEKIKTIGDAYMVAGGLPIPREDHAEAMADLALEMQQATANFQVENSTPFEIRIGINTGSVVAGVIGIKKFIYDLWGDTVNVASRMESQGEPGRIQVTAHTYKLLQDKYVFQERGAITVKGKGEMTTYWLVSRN